LDMGTFAVSPLYERADHVSGLSLLQYLR
jgi:hypothetical protein